MNTSIKNPKPLQNRSFIVATVCDRRLPAIFNQRPRSRMCLAWSLRERTERGVYAASAWRDPCDVAELHERQESADDEAA